MHDHHLGDDYNLISHHQDAALHPDERGMGFKAPVVTMGCFEKPSRSEQNEAIIRALGRKGFSIAVA